MNDTGQVKVTINLSGEALQAVRDLAAKRGRTMTEIFREAISTEKFLDDAMTRGERILLADNRGRKTREIVFR